MAALDEALKPFQERTSEAEYYLPGWGGGGIAWTICSSVVTSPTLLPCWLWSVDNYRSKMYFIRIAKLEALLYNQDGTNSGSETSSSATKDLQSKLDAVSAECLTEKEKNKKLIMENEKLQYRITHLIRAIKEAESR